MTAGELLASSIGAHTRYREALAGARSLHALARAAMVEAEQLRRRAQDLDPRRQDPVWAAAEKTHPHDALLTFYAEQLAR